MPRVVAKAERAGALIGGLGCDEAVLESIEHHQRLVGGAGRVLLLHAAIGPRLERIIVEQLFFFCAQTAGHAIRVVSRRGVEGENEAGVDVDRDDRAGLALERFLRGALQIEID